MLGSKIRNITDKRLRRLAILADKERNKIEYGWQARVAKKIGVHRSTITQWIDKNRIPEKTRDEKIVARGYPLKDWWDEPEAQTIAQKRQSSKPTKIDQGAAASRIIELLKEPEWTMTDLARTISKYLTKPLERRLLEYHLKEGHVRPQWHEGIREYFGSLADYALFGDIAEEMGTEERCPFFSNLCQFATELLKENRGLKDKIEETQKHLNILEMFFEECESLEDVEERRQIWEDMKSKKPTLHLTSKLYETDS